MTAILTIAAAATLLAIVYVAWPKATRGVAAYRAVNAPRWSHTNLTISERRRAIHGVSESMRAHPAHACRPEDCGGIDYDPCERAS